MIAQIAQSWVDNADIKDILGKLPGKNCGLCGFQTCEEFAVYISERPDEIKKCVILHDRNKPVPDLRSEDIGWKDMLDREYDFILDSFPDDPGPREVILPFNPANVEKLMSRAE